MGPTFILEFLHPWGRKRSGSRRQGWCVADRAALGSVCLSVSRWSPCVLQRGPSRAGFPSVTALSWWQTDTLQLWEVAAFNLSLSLFFYCRTSSPPSSLSLVPFPHTLSLFRPGGPTQGFPSYRVDNSFHLGPPGRQLLPGNHGKPCWIADLVGLSWSPRFCMIKCSLLSATVLILISTQWVCLHFLCFCCPLDVLSEGGWLRNATAHHKTLLVRR